MSKNLIYVILIVCGVLIAYIIVGGIFKNDLKKTVKNPYEFDLRSIRKIDPAQVKYRETKRIGVTYPAPKVIDYYAGYLVIGFENHLQVIDTSGVELFNKSVAGPVTGVTFSPRGEIFLGCKTHIEKYDLKGELIETWSDIDSSSFITSIACADDRVYVADAKGPKVYQYDLSGEILHSFDGKNRTDTRYGFIIPSPYFDLDIDSEGALWAVNTGVQAIENYNSDGSLRAYWGKSSYDLSGFIGCCNPAQFAILANDSFVTCEKGLVRIKVYLPSGELDGVVATPDDFDTNSEPPDLTSDELNNIYMLDITRKMLRKYERKDS
jgi:hypothetical protein